MQPTPNNRRRVAAAASPAAAVAVDAPALSVLRFTMANGVLELQDAPLVQALLVNEQHQRLAAEAEQAALRVIYRLGGKPDPTKPHNGLLTERLDISRRTAEQLLRDGKLRHTCTGDSKGYRVTERAVREYLGDIPPS
jgi:excisionase family DNA binding protein